MIKEEFLNDGTLIKHWSDKGVYLMQVETNTEYSEPIDIYPCPYTYEETSHVIGEETEEESTDEA